MNLHIKMLEYDDRLGKLAEIKKSLSPIKKKLAEMRSRDNELSTSIREYSESVDHLRSLCVA